MKMKYKLLIIGILITVIGFCYYAGFWEWLWNEFKMIVHGEKEKEVCNEN